MTENKSEDWTNLTRGELINKYNKAKKIKDDIQRYGELMTMINNLDLGLFNIVPISTSNKGDELNPEWREAEERLRKKIDDYLNERRKELVHRWTVIGIVIGIIGAIVTIIKLIVA